jgi:putative Ca2+/H+ antiporter (TMEM165/GDT1 family)
MLERMRQPIVIFVSVFLAEIGDKTQLATMLFATDTGVGKLGVFLSAASALVLSTLVAVLAGEWITRIVPPSTLKIAAGVGFILIGLWTVVTAAR